MLPYNAEALFALYARYLQDLWPIALALYILTPIGMRLAWHAGPNAGRIAGGLLALGWFWVGLAFHLGYFAALNFAAPLYAGLFILQGLLLVWYGPVRGSLALRLRTDATGWTGICVTLFAALGYPLLDILSGHPLDGPRLVGLAPGPTALFTVGVLLHTVGPTPWPLLAVPLVWSLIAAFSGWVLGLTADLAALPLAAIALGAAWSKNRRHEFSGRPGG